MSAEEFSRALKNFRCQEETAHFLGVAQTSVSRWALGKRAVPQIVAELLRLQAGEHPTHELAFVVRASLLSPDDVNLIQTALDYQALTLRELAERLGVGYSSVAKWARGRHPPSGHVRTFLLLLTDRHPTLRMRRKENGEAEARVEAHFASVVGEKVSRPLTRRAEAPARPTAR